MGLPKKPVMITVATLYQFTPLPEPAALRAPLLDLCRALRVKGTILLAREGINGTIAGTADGVARVLAHVGSFANAPEVKYSGADTTPFHRMKVRVKEEIVTMGLAGIDPSRHRGRYVAAQDWNGLIAAPGTLLIDVRNSYETAIGSFAGALDPGTASFRDFPAWFRAHRQEVQGASRVAMFCTGGIRCEKASAFLKQEGIAEVHHLQGGILRYLEDTAPGESLWQGECFVFDQRVALTHGLAPGTHGLCHACRIPVGEADRASPFYREGVSCPACHASRSDAARARYGERQRQMQMAARRGTAHIGAAQEN